MYSRAPYWDVLYHPLIRYILKSYKPDLAMIGYPTTDEFQHQFLGLVSPTLPGGAPNPAYDDVQVQRHARRPCQGARGIHPPRLCRCGRHAGPGPVG